MEQALRRIMPDEKDIVEAKEKLSLKLLKDLYKASKKHGQNSDEMFRQAITSRLASRQGLSSSPAFQEVKYEQTKVSEYLRHVHIKSWAWEPELK